MKGKQWKCVSPFSPGGWPSAVLDDAFGFEDALHRACHRRTRDGSRHCLDEMGCGAQQRRLDVDGWFVGGVFPQSSSIYRWIFPYKLSINGGTPWLWKPSSWFVTPRTVGFMMSYGTYFQLVSMVYQPNNIGTPLQLRKWVDDRNSSKLVSKVDIS